MASLNEQTEFDIPFITRYTELKCPACDEPLSVIATVDVSGGLVQKHGESGFKAYIYNVTLESKVRCFTIQHQCQPKYKE